MLLSVRRAGDHRICLYLLDDINALYLDLSLGRVFFTFNPEYYGAVSGQEVVKVAEANLKTKVRRCSSCS